MKVIAAVAITVIVVLLLLWSLTSSNTSPQTMASSSTEVSKVMESAPKSAPVHKVNHLNKLTVDAAGCSNVTGPGYYDPEWEWARRDLCQADAHSVKNGQRVNWSLVCNPKWATCVGLTPNEDYYFEVVSGIPECQNAARLNLTCVKIHARPYDAIYINAKREKR
jgi:hypothetical protein